MNNEDTFIVQSIVGNQLTISAEANPKAILVTNKHKTTLKQAQVVTVAKFPDERRDWSG